MFDWIWNYRKQAVFLLTSLVMIMLILGMRGVDKEEWQPFAAANDALGAVVQSEDERNSVQLEAADPPARPSGTAETSAEPEQVPVTTSGEDYPAVTESAHEQAAFTDTSFLININTASISELTSLSGIGPSKASAIVDYRIQQGAFQHIDEIMKVKGIGMKTFEKFKDQITVN